MNKELDLVSLKAKAELKDRYAKQLHRLKGRGIQTDCIESAVTDAVGKLSDQATTSLVIYGEPQSGKTEMMICLTAKLLDSGFGTIVHLLNDSVDLLSQNLLRFKSSALAPAAKTASEFPEGSGVPQEVVVLCKKNTNDLQNLIAWLGDQRIAVAAGPSIDKKTVTLDKGEISFGQLPLKKNWITSQRGLRTRLRL